MPQLRNQKNIKPVHRYRCDLDRTATVSVRRKHHDPRTNRCALVKVDYILVDHADAAGGNARADGPRFDGAVDTVKRVLVALPEVHGAGTERVARASMHAEATL